MDVHQEIPSLCEVLTCSVESFDPKCLIPLSDPMNLVLYTANGWSHSSASLWLLRICWAMPIPRRSSLAQSWGQQQTPWWESIFHGSQNGKAQQMCCWRPYHAWLQVSSPKIEQFELWTLNFSALPTDKIWPSSIIVHPSCTVQGKFRPNYDLSLIGPFVKGSA